MKKLLQSNIAINSDADMERNHQLLQSVVGIVKSCHVNLFTCSALRNSPPPSKQHLLVYIPQLNESGKLKGRTTMSKNGPSRVRAKLFLAAISASTHNPDIREQKRRLLAAGKTKMQALGAAMRKLIQICFGVLKTQTKYQPQVTLN